MLLPVVCPVASPMTVLTGFSYCGSHLDEESLIKFSLVNPFEGAFHFLPDSDRQSSCYATVSFHTPPHSYHGTVCRCLLGSLAHWLSLFDGPLSLIH